MYFLFCFGIFFLLDFSFDFHFGERKDTKLGREGGWVYKTLGEEKNMIKYVISLKFNKKLSKYCWGKCQDVGSHCFMQGLVWVWVFVGDTETLKTAVYIKLQNSEWQMPKQ